MDITVATLAKLIRIAIGTATDDDYCFDPSTPWDSVFGMAQEQGVVALSFEGLLKVFPEKSAEELGMPRRQKMQWISSTEEVELHYRKQFAAAKHLGDIYAKEGIRTFVMKGISASTYYPVPEHRECGDMDCFLDGRYEDGNVAAERSGGVVDRSYYKNSHIVFEGLMIENHQFCLPVRGSRKKKDAEIYLEKTIRECTDPHPIGSTALLLPPPSFHAFFLTFHAATHFLSEGICLRHMLDWALFLQTEQNNVNWKEVYEQTEKLGYTRFAGIMSAIARDFFGIKITNPDIRFEGEAFKNDILDNTFYHVSHLYNQGGPAYLTRIKLVRNYIREAWKYHRIFKKSVLWETLQSVFAFFFEKKPKL